MIVDIIAMPIKVPDNEEVNMKSIMWLPIDMGVGDVCIETSRNLHDTRKHLYRYKIIERHCNMWIERSVVTFDEMNEQMRLSAFDTGDVDLYPITTKIYDNSSGQCKVSIYRHLNSLQTLLCKSTQHPATSLYSIHQLFLRSVAGSMSKFGRTDLNGALIAYATANKARLSRLVCADEHTNGILLSKVDSLANTYLYDLFSDDEYEFVELIDELCQLPKPSNPDMLLDLQGNSSIVNTRKLRSMIDPDFSRRFFGINLTTHDIFDVDNTVHFTVDPTLRLTVMAMVNRLEMLPYTDVSITCSSIGVKVNYAISRFTETSDFTTYPCPYPIGITDEYYLARNTYENQHTFILDICAVVWDLIESVYPNCNRRATSFSIVKTFCDNVYIIVNLPNNKTLKFYFDITTNALGTLGIVDINIVNNIVNKNDMFWQFINQLHTL